MKDEEDESDTAPSDSSDSNSFDPDAEAFDFGPEILASPILRRRAPPPFPDDDPQGQYLLARTRASPFARTIPIRRYAQLRARNGQCG